MSDTVDLTDAWNRVQSLPAIALEDADRLARDFGLTVTGPDGDGLVWAEIVDPDTRARRVCSLGPAGGETAAAWLAWRNRPR